MLWQVLPTSSVSSVIFSSLLWTSKTLLMSKTS